MYDDGQLFQNCLTAINIVRRQGRNPTCVRMNVNTAKAILQQTDIRFEPDAEVYIRIGNLPVKLTAAIQDGFVKLGYEKS